MADRADREVSSTEPTGSAESPREKSAWWDIPLTIGALLSASAFGSQACFYSDSTVLAAQGSCCNLISHAITQLPYTLIAAGLAFIGFILIA